MCRQLRRGSRRGRGEQAVPRHTWVRRLDRHQAGAADAAAAVEAVRPDSGWRGVRGGCIRWRAATETGAEALTWRALARSGMMFGAGVAYAVVSVGAAHAPRQSWFGPGFVVGTAVLVLLSMPVPVRTPVCRRPLWRKTRTTLRALASNSSFAAIVDSAGPFGPIAWYRRTGCTDEFWFTVPPGQGNLAVVFQVNRVAPGARLAVHMSLRDVMTPGASWPTRTITVADVLPEAPRGTGGGDDPRPPKRLVPSAAGR